MDVVLPPDRLPLIRINLSYPKTNFLRSRIFRTSWRFQDTNKITVIYQYMPSLIILYYISLSHTTLFKIHAKNGQGHASALATQNGLFVPWIPCYGSEWLYCGALRFVLPEPEVLAKIKIIIFYKAFCLLFLQLQLSQMPLK